MRIVTLIPTQIGFAARERAAAKRKKRRGSGSRSLISFAARSDTHHRLFRRA
jgi:hypothetical protein